VQKFFRRKLGPNFKIDATPVNTIWGAFAVQDIEGSPTVETLDIEGNRAVWFESTDFGISRVIVVPARKRSSSTSPP
jgi:hypothetical protein